MTPDDRPRTAEERVADATFYAEWDSEREGGDVVLASLAVKIANEHAAAATARAEKAEKERDEAYKSCTRYNDALLKAEAEVGRLRALLAEPEPYGEVDENDGGTQDLVSGFYWCRRRDAALAPAQETQP